jgi:hypothetical protein
MARTGLRMMPTFPSSPLKFRTAGFPQYGFKASLSDSAFRPGAQSRRIVCIHPSCSPRHPALPALSRGQVLGEAPLFG